MRLALLALVIAVNTLSSAPLRGQNWVQPHFFGPHTFTRAEGSPAATTMEFGIPPLIHGPFVLTADSKDATSLRVKLNGVQVLDDNNFRGHISQSIDVPLEASNTLTLEMGGSQGESVTIGVSGYQYAESGQYSALNITHAAVQSNASADIDWRTKGAVGPVENEGQCGSDWAFSAKGAVEGEHFRTTGKLQVLSAQELVDCAHEGGAQACNGGLPEDGLLYIKKYGAMASSAYTYTALLGACKRNPAVTVAKIGGILRSPVGDDAALLAMLETHGPVSVIIDGNWTANYRGGIQTNCGSGVPHFVAALLVGAKTDSATGNPYWLLKFPFGTAFGINGYAHLSRRRSNECGITDYAIVPLP